MYEIFVDSAANIPSEIVEKNRIHVITFMNLVGGENVPGYEAGLSLEEEREKGKKYYDALRSGADVKTSLINTGTFIDVFTPVLKEGKDILYISLSKNISGTYNAAKLAKEDLDEEFPDRKVLLVDAMNASLGQGLLAIYARTMEEKGVSVEEAARILTDAVPHTNGLFTVGDLKYLAKTGRIKNYVATVGNILSLKPILCGNKDGFIIQFKVLRGRKKSLDELVNLVVNNIVEPEKQILGIAHADAYPESLEVIRKIRERVPVKDVINTSYDFCTGSHVGPDTIALFFIAYDRELKGASEGYRRPEIFDYI